MVSSFKSRTKNGEKIQSSQAKYRIPGGLGKQRLPPSGAGFARGVRYRGRASPLAKRRMFSSGFRTHGCNSSRPSSSAPTSGSRLFAPAVARRRSCGLLLQQELDVGRKQRSAAAIAVIQTQLALRVIHVATRRMIHGVAGGRGASHFLVIDL